VEVEDIPVIDSRWIPCSERLPDDDKSIQSVEYLVSVAGEVTTGFWDTELEWWLDRRRCAFMSEPEFWMPLPEPPNGSVVYPTDQRQKTQERIGGEKDGQ
jgi:hypothetical protein